MWGEGLDYHPAFRVESGRQRPLSVFCSGQDLNPPVTASRYSTQNADALPSPASFRISKSFNKVRGLSLSRASKSSRNARVDELVRNRGSPPPARLRIPATRISWIRASVGL